MVEVRYVDGDYLDNNPDWHAADSPFKARWIFEILQRNGIHPRSFAEIGCGVGEILVELKKRYPEAKLSGFEVSPQAFSIASTKATSDIDFTLGDFLTSDRAGFDVAMAIDVFEHVPDYMNFIKGVAGKGTYKLFHVPLDLSVSSMMRPHSISHVREIIGHLHYFTKDTALATIRDCGLEVIDWNYTHGAVELPNRGLKTRLANVPRRLMGAVSDDLAVRLFGGASVMILAK